MHFVDMWAIGPIIVEVVTKRPMFTDCEIDMLYKIFRILGTPTNQLAGVTNLKDWNPAFSMAEDLLRSIAPT